MTPADFIAAARVPKSLPAQEFGLWSIRKRPILRARELALLGVDLQTILFRASMAWLHVDGGEIVMDDSRPELARHLPIWLAAHGRVLVTGLGLGCVVRGLLAKPEIEHIDVLEIDLGILNAVGPEFLRNPRVTLHLADALTWEPPPRAHWDFAWHDIHDDDGRLQLLHVQLLTRFLDFCGAQGAWGFPRPFKRAWENRVGPLLGSSRGVL